MSKKQSTGVDFNKITTIKLGESAVDGLGRWSAGLMKPLGISRLPFEEGAILLTITETGVGDSCQVYFKDEDQRVKCEIYIDKRFHTQWYINYQRFYFNTASNTLESIPDSPSDLALIGQMSTILSHALVYIAMYHDDPNLVLFLNKYEVTLRVPANAPTAPGDIATVKPILGFGNPIALDPRKPLGGQISTHLNNYYKEWIYRSLPALKGKTPIEASKTPEGRKELHELFEYMRKMQSPIPFPFDDVKKALSL
ncbi:hypothetical protein ABES02_29530 [Neobacillus pocheonensis]|uniref:hypothetical protein n=1 Tax=Neobacillus pocheonensis TaxID=363869 RepID=UPI003D27619E